MTNSFSTTKLNEALGKQRLKLEEERQSLFEKTQQWLNEFAEKYGI
ncbi:hypothetical protein [Crocosphaera sp. XPORK-15E]|nr:hypothetical protein [Crocosphaera sp. XPORK-15E]MEA5533647.1 hypothetical protein [Crocosphaera sp. XPORK-15E]